MSISVVKAVKELFYQSRHKYYTDIESRDSNVSINLGWGRLFFAQTYDNHQELADELLSEKTGERNLAFYVKEPQILLDKGKGDLFLSPSLAYRLPLHLYTPLKEPTCTTRFLLEKDIEEANAVYQEVRSLPIDISNTIKNQRSPALTYFVATIDDEVVGVVIGIDHKKLFNTPDDGASLWGLAVSKKAQGKGVGKQLINCVAEHFKVKGRDYMDLSVLYENEGAIKVYENMGFQKIQRFCVKCKNDINANLYYD